MEQSLRGFGGFVALAVLAAACGSSPARSDGAAGTSGSAGTAGSAGTTGSAGTGGSGGGAGTGGSAGSGGSAGTAGSAGTGGSAGTAGSGGSAGTGGSAGSAGSGGSAVTDAGSDADAWVANGCQVSTPPASALISNFSMVDGGVAVIPIGGSTVFGVTPPTVTVQNEAWHFEGGQGSVNRSGVAIFFAACVDARAYTGVRFTVISEGTAVCNATLSIVDTAHFAAGGIFPNASGPPDSHPGRYPYKWTLQGPATTMMQFPFNAPYPYPEYGPSPETALDPTKLIGLQWTFSGAGTDICYLRVSIDDVGFYTGGADGGADAP